MKWITFCGCLLLLWSPVNAQTGSEKEIRLAVQRLIPCTPVRDQYLSATCWSFSSNSLLESELLRNGKDPEDISEMFVARYSMVRKIKRHLQLKGTNFFTPGGQFHDVAWVMRNFGMMPEEAYPGFVRGQWKHNHGDLDTLLSRFIRTCLQKGVTELSSVQERYVDSLLDRYLGAVPDFFEYRGRTYTPRSYLDQYLEIDPDDFVEITSYTHHPFNSRFVLEDKYNWTGDAYLNVSLQDFRRITDRALDSGFTVGWDGDADDPDFDYGRGLAFFPEPLTGDLTVRRQEAFTSGTTLLDHMMHVIGKSLDSTGHTWYYIKNSWGATTNSRGGYLWMRDDYFLLRTVAIIVNKRAVPGDIRARTGLF